MKKIFIIGLFFSMFSLSSCIEALGEAAKAVNESNKINTESSSVNFYNTIEIDALYSLDLPYYMKKSNNLHPEALLQYANIYKEAYTIVIHENKNDFKSFFREFNEYDEELSVIENYYLAQINMFNENVEDLKKIDYGLLKINDYPARQVKILGKMENIDVFYIITLIEGTENIYMIMSWTLKEKMKNFENIFEQINGSFKLIPTNEIS